MVISPAVLFQTLVSDLDALPGSIPDAFFPGATQRQAAAIHLKANFLKKLLVDVKPDANERALERYLACNEACKSWSLALETSLDELLVGEFQRSIDRFCHPMGMPMSVDPFDLLDRIDIGPGSSVGALGKDFYTKLFSSPHTTTSLTLSSFYDLYHESNSTWADAEAFRRSVYGPAVLVEGEVLGFAPKRTDISRVICTQPLLNMLYQKGGQAILEERIREVWGIDFDTQPFVNRELAWYGSMDGEFATLDLKDASNSVGLRMVRHFFPDYFVRFLEECRSPSVVLPDGTKLELSIMSSMGNATTFPLQVIIFSSVVSAVYNLLGIKLERSRRGSPGNFSVFGDDIIVKTRAYSWVVRLLTLLGFVTNEEKSFSEGPFRESCGADYYSGMNIRPVYLKRLDSPQDVAVVANRLNDWTSRTGIRLPATLQLLDKSYRLPDVPLFENDDAGIKVPFDLVRKVPESDELGNKRYKRYSARSRMLRFANGRVIVPKGEKLRLMNKFGLLLSMSASHVRSTMYEGNSVPSVSIGKSSDAPTLYRREWQTTPYWDGLPQVDLGFLDSIRVLGVRRAVTDNMLHRYLAPQSNSSD